LGKGPSVTGDLDVPQSARDPGTLPVSYGTYDQQPPGTSTPVTFQTLASSVLKSSLILLSSTYSSKIAEYTKHAISLAGLGTAEPHPEKEKIWIREASVPSSLSSRSRDAEWVYVSYPTFDAGNLRDKPDTAWARSVSLTSV